MDSTAAANAPRKQENIFASLIFNVAIPMFILSKLSGESNLGPLHALLVSLLFPLGYALYDFYQRRQANFISILGFVSILVTGLFGIFKVDGFWFAVKEASIPSLLGIVTIVSVWLKKPLVNYFVFNENVFNMPLLNEHLEKRNARKEFQKLIHQFTFVLGIFLLVGGMVNFTLAINIIVSPSGTEAFNQELAKVKALTHFAVLLPKLIIISAGLWWFIKRLKQITGLNTNELLKSQ